MAKDPAFLFYSNDFDVATKFFSHEQVGKYLRLLITQHQHGHLSEQQMKFICGTHDKEVCAKFKQDENGLFYNERLESEIVRRSNYSESRSENRKGKGKKGKRINNPKITSKSYDISSDIHMETETETTTESILGKKGEGKKPFLENPFSPEFLTGIWETWKEYRKDKKCPIKSVKSENITLKHLHKLAEGNESTAIGLLEKAISNGWQGFDYGAKGQINGTSTRPQTENQRIRELVNNNTNLVPEADRYVEVPDPAGGITMTGRLFLDDDGLMKFVKAGRIRLTVDPQSGFKPSAVYKLAPGMTIDKIYESLLIEKRKSA